MRLQEHIYVTNHRICTEMDSHKNPPSIENLELLINACILLNFPHFHCLTLGKVSTNSNLILEISRWWFSGAPAANKEPRWWLCQHRWPLSSLSSPLSPSPSPPASCQCVYDYVSPARVADDSLLVLIANALPHWLLQGTKVDHKNTNINKKQIYNKYTLAAALDQGWARIWKTVNLEKIFSSSDLKKRSGVEQVFLGAPCGAQP